VAHGSDGAPARPRSRSPPPRSGPQRGGRGVDTRWGRPPEPATAASRDRITRWKSVPASSSPHVAHDVRRLRAAAVREHGEPLRRRHPVDEDSHAGVGDAARRRATPVLPDSSTNSHASRRCRPQSRNGDSSTNSHAGRRCRPQSRNGD
jgi:hypothetical protein